MSLSRGNRGIIGAILGDIVESVHENAGTKTTRFPLFPKTSRFTDDTVLTIATADAIMSDGDYAKAYREWAGRYPDRGYGKEFRKWLATPNAGPYGSFGNGSAMRVSPVAYALNSIEEVLAEAKRSASVTHDHPEGIKGAQAVALAVFLSRMGVPREEIRQEIAQRFKYDLSRTLAEIRPSYAFDVTCQGSVPQALTAFFETNGLEEAIRAAVSLGGDADTQAAIAGSAAGADGYLTPTMRRAFQRMLPAEMHQVIEQFRAKS